MKIKPKIAVAMSGGMHSSSLAILLSKWCAEHKVQTRGAVDIIGLTVDHNLNESGRNEALAVHTCMPVVVPIATYARHMSPVWHTQVGEWARELGFQHHILTSAHNKFHHVQRMNQF